MHCATQSAWPGSSVQLASHSPEHVDLHEPSHSARFAEPSHFAEQSVEQLPSQVPRQSKVAGSTLHSASHEV
jgi:hypothetical protein